MEFSCAKWPCASLAGLNLGGHPPTDRARHGRRLVGDRWATPNRLVGWNPRGLQTTQKKKWRTPSKTLESGFLEDGKEEGGEG